ncbi:MAG: DUF1707 SHOCT-like domain-containing protein [Nocardioides sp.]
MAEAFWGEFELDPRHPSFAPLRASDRDRELVNRVLTEGYAQGRLDREELDTRATALAAARTLGELPPLVTDLVPLTPSAALGPHSLGPEELRKRAVANWERSRRDAIWTVLSASLICWVIWFAIGLGDGRFDAGFPWPLFVTAGTALNAARIQYRRQDLIADEVRSLERKQERERRRELEQLPHDPDEPASE